MGAADDEEVRGRSELNVGKDLDEFDVGLLGIR